MKKPLVLAVLLLAGCANGDAVQRNVSIFRKAMNLVCRGWNVVEPYIPAGAPSDAGAADASAFARPDHGATVDPAASGAPVVSSGGGAQ